MKEIPSVDELAQVMREAQSEGQSLSIEQLAAIAHAEVMRKKRAAIAARVRATRQRRIARELAQAS